ncbi:hypothetical protein V3C99_017870 [Haemonchus contortus]|uniref:Uncharacterized protein n=1 Tax=Haemonchus contortus TaxID=6289 RepID=A0A7I4Z1Y6_HAECO
MWLNSSRNSSAVYAPAPSPEKKQLKPFRENLQKLYRTAEELHVGTYETEWSEYDETLFDFITSTHTIRNDPQLKKPFHSMDSGSRGRQVP